MSPLEWIAAGHVAATLIVGIGQIAIVAVGIRAMNRSSDERARERERMEAESVRRHAETMAALTAQTRTLDEGTAALRAVVERTNEGTAALRESTAALRAVVERTAPGGAS